MKRLISAAGLAVFAGQANALDCLFGNGAEAFNQAKQEGADFRAVIGAIEWDQASDAVHRGGFVMEFEGQHHDAAAQFTGEVIGADGARAPIDESVHIVAYCINGDCGYASDEGEMLTFLHDTRRGTVMYTYPCQSYPRFPDPDSVALVQDCVDGEFCRGF